MADSIKAKDPRVMITDSGKLFRRSSNVRWEREMALSELSEMENRKVIISNSRMAIPRSPNVRCERKTTPSELSETEKRKVIITDSQKTIRHPSDGLCLRDMTLSELSEYYRMIGETGGFDVDVEKIKDVFSFGVIFPIEDLSEDSMNRRLTRLASHALKKHNEEKGEELEFVRIIKANGQYAAGVRYYITFEAKDAKEKDDPKPKVYQLRVFQGIDHDDIRIQVFRPKPSPPAASSSS